MVHFNRLVSLLATLPPVLSLLSSSKEKMQGADTRTEESRQGVLGKQTYLSEWWILRSIIYTSRLLTNDFKDGP